MIVKTPPWNERDTVTQMSETPAALLTPAEVATLFRVDPKTVTRWAKSGKISAVRTLGGHRRYHKEEVEDLLRRSAGTE